MSQSSVVRGLVACAVVLCATAATATAESVQLQCNFNGIIHPAEWTGASQPNPGIADVPAGYRSIADRGFRVDGQAGALGTNPIIGATGLTYQVVTTANVLDMIMLGNRNLVNGAGYAFDTVVDTDERGIVPTWLPDPDLTGAQVTTIASPILITPDTQIGVIYHISNGGGIFEMVLGFTDSSTLTVPLHGPDWFGPQDNWFSGNSIPSPIPASGGVASLSRLGIFNSVSNIDNANVTGATLNATEIVVTVPQLVFDGFGDISGKSLSSITFQNPSNTASYGIFAVSVAEGAPAPLNDECVNATPVSEGIHMGTSGGATGDSFASCGFGDDNKDVWFRYTATRTGTARIATCGSSFDTTLAVYDACGGNELACNDDECFLQSQVEISVTAGAQYLIRIAGVSGSAGAYTLTITNPPEVLLGPIVNPANGHTYYMLVPMNWVDSEAYAQTLGGHLVTINSDEERTWVINNLAALGGQTRTTWIGFTDQDEEGNWQWANKEAVTYTAWNGGEPNDAGGNEDYCEMQFSGGWNDVDGANNTDHYGIVEIPTVPANDTCAAAIAVTEGEYTGSSDGATGAATSSCGSGDTNDVWYDYTASRTGTTRISLCRDPADALFDTTLAVYSACGGATLACNDNYCGEQSQVELAVTAGAHYFIRVAGNAGATGGFRMGITNPPGILCGPITNPANGSEYFLITKVDWPAGEAQAQTMGGHLVTINNAEENDWVMQNVLSCIPAGTAQWAWIGLHETEPNSDIWTWSSGQIDTYRNWSPGEPNLLDTELAAQMVDNGQWNNLPDTGHSWMNGEYAIVEIDAPGACCLAGETCAVLSTDDCTTQGGFFLGGGSTCDPNPCLAGACCQTDGTCSIMTPADCVMGGGIFNGAPSCDPNPCAQPGACCVDSTCSMSPTIGPAWCLSLGGLYQGDNTTCDLTPCPQDECANASEIFSDIPVFGTNGFATGVDITSCADGGSGGLGDYNDVWYKWTAPNCDVSVNFSMCDGPAYDASMAIFDTCGGTELACDDDGCGIGGGPSTVTMSATANTTYYIRIAGWDGSTGDFRLLVTNAPCLGACCIGSVCAVMPESACLGAGGVYKGDNTVCGAGTCGCAGDANCDGRVDFKDIDPFVSRLGCPNSNPTACNTGCAWQNCDVNNDGSVTFGDIDPFVGTLGSMCN